MSKSETYQEWQPLPGLSGKVLVEKIVDNDDGLSIYLRFPSHSTLKEKKVCITFDSYVAYRNMDESYRARTFALTHGFKTSYIGYRFQLVKMDP